MYLATLLASMLLVSGCAALHAEKDEDPFADATFLPEYTQIGWLWTDEQKEPVPYLPREGDIIFASSIARSQTFLYRTVARIGLPHHMMIVIKNSSGQLATFEVGAAPDDSVVIRPVCARLKFHKEEYPGATVYVRQIKRDLTCEESQRLTSFAESQLGKPFSKPRDLIKLGLPNRPLKTNGRCTKYWFCSQLAVQSLVESGIIKCVDNAGKFVPEDAYLDTEYDFSGLWTKPTEWTFGLEPTKVKPLRHPTRKPIKPRAKKQ